MILLDVNVLIYAFWPGAPEHAAATQIASTARSDFPITYG